MESIPPGTGPVSPDFTGMDPELMDRFIAAMEQARDVIGENMAAIRQVFVANGMSTVPLGPIDEVEAWIGEQVPELRRRNQMVHGMAALPSWAPGGMARLVGYDEQLVLPAADARRQGRALGEEYARIEPIGFMSWGRTSSDAYERVISQLATHKYDADFTAAFFAAIGPAGTLEITSRLRENLDTEGYDPNTALRAVSIAFAAAVSGGAKVPGFAQVMNSVAKPGKSDKPERVRSQVAGLLAAGDFPPEWLAGVVTAYHGLDPKRLEQGFLYALGDNPAAARMAISAATPKEGLPRLLRDLNDHAGVRYAYTEGMADPFGRMLAAAAGAYDERDGAHSQDAARFAFAVMTTFGGLTVGDGAKVHMSEIAGSYASEITEGADLGDADQLQPSAFEPVQSRVPGLTPAFRLSPRDTYRFISTFADGKANLTPFQIGMGDLARRLIDKGVPQILKTKDATRLDDIFAALGNVRGFELAANEKFARAADDAAETKDKWVSLTVGTAFTITGYGIAAEAGGKLWDALSTGYSALDTFKPAPPTEVDKVRSTDDLETLGRQHAIAQSLMDAGFPPKITPHEYQATCPPGVAITDGNGRLRPFEEIVKSGEQGLRALDRWLLENGMGSDKASLGDLSEDLATSFDGHKDRSGVRAPLYSD